MTFCKNDKFPATQRIEFNFQNDEQLYKTTCHIYLDWCFLYEVISVFKVFQKQ